MEEGEDKGFRVIDKRGSSNQEESHQSDSADDKKTKAESGSLKQGEGFVMGEKPDAERDSRHGHPEEIDFSTLVFSLATGALIHLGLAPDPASQKTEKNLTLAKQNIDILSLLQEKTKGNLTEQEKSLLEGLLTEVRLKYVELSR